MVSFLLDIATFMSTAKEILSCIGMPATANGMLNDNGKRRTGSL